MKPKGTTQYVVDCRDMDKFILEHTGQEWGNRSGTHRWLVVVDGFGNEHAVNLEDVEPV